MEVLKNEQAAQNEIKSGAEKVESVIESSPTNKAVIFPPEKKARRKCTLSDEW